ncbi:MAG TPA: hypothetical protein PLT07_01445 [Trueperaceae bacterium]|nr:hypothetical protein [Trueperaceae bacterium]
MKNLTEATALATEFCDPTQTTVQEVSALDAADLLAFTVPQGLSIQAAVDAASAGATINIEAGTHTSSGVNVGTPSLKIVGASAGTTVIQGNNPDGLDTTSGFDYGFSLSAANIEISGLHLQDYYADVNLGNAPGAYLHDLEFSSSRIAIRTPTLHNIDGLRFEDSSIHDTNSGILLQHGKTNPTPARHVTFDGLTFADVAHKGMYLEAFTDSTIQNIVMNRVGNGYGPDNVETPPSTALELNLKYHDHGTVTLSNIEINDSGWSNATADYSGATTPTHINAAALAIAVRDDGGYATNPAALSNLVLNDITITGAYRAIRLGEAKVLEPASVFTTGAASTVLRGLHIAGSGEFTIANYTLSDVDATNATNIIDGYRVPDDNFEIEARLRHGTSDARLGIIHLAPDSVYAIASRSLATTVSAAAANDTIHVSDGSHVLDSTISIPGSKALTMRGQSWAAEVSAPASGPSIYFDVYGSGTTIEGLSLISLGGTNPQNLIGIKGADVSIRNNSFSGVYADGDGAVSRAIEVSPGVQNVTIDGNTIHGLRQPAYFNPGVAGRVTNNRVFGTRGWVVDGALVDFSGNTWRETGTGVSENYGCDIALLVGTTSSAPYDDLVALAAANGGILLNLTDGSSSCDQR